MWLDFAALAKLQLADFWKLQLSGIAVFFALCLAEGLLTRPWRPRRPEPELVADMFYWVTAAGLRMISRLLLISLLALFAIFFGMKIGPELFDGFGPLAQQPRWLVVIELLVLMDMSSYWSHRLFHTVPALWRFHAIHHSSKTIRWSTTARVHPINEIATYLTSTVPFFLVGFPIGAVLPLLPFIMIYALLAHAQWNPGFGPLGYVFASPRFHKWHHTHSSEGGNKNFGNVFSIWDRLFGTAYMPKGRLASGFGLDHDDMPKSYFGQLLYPFRVPSSEQSVRESRSRERPIRVPNSVL